MTQIALNATLGKQALRENGQEGPLHQRALSPYPCDFRNATQPFSLPQMYPMCEPLPVPRTAEVWGGQGLREPSCAAPQPRLPCSLLENPSNKYLWSASRARHQGYGGSETAKVLTSGTCFPVGLGGQQARKQICEDDPSVF